MHDYSILIQEMIRVLASLMGLELVVNRARQAEIDVDDNGNVVSCGADSEAATKNFLKQFKALSGDLATNYLIGHLDYIFSEYPEFKEFLEKQKE